MEIENRIEKLERFSQDLQGVICDNTEKIRELEEKLEMVTISTELKSIKRRILRFHTFTNNNNKTQNSDAKIPNPNEYYDWLNNERMGILKTIIKEHPGFNTFELCKSMLNKTRQSKYFIGRNKILVLIHQMVNENIIIRTPITGKRNSYSYSLDE